ncbi:MAG: hypothetical protein ACO3N7_10150 [Kiritimatiellia bacterium]
MKMNVCFSLRKPFFFLFLLLSGCASVEKRIDANAEVFATFPPEVQETLRKGEIEVGYTPKMVEIAKGKPTYVNLKKTEDGSSTVWRYVEFRQYSRAVPVYDTGVRGTGWVDVSETQEFEYLRVEFRDDAVIAFEAAQPQ